MIAIRQTIHAVIFDWAGTTVDHGSRAPVAAVVEAFRQERIALTEAQARGPMGLAKRDHIGALLALPEIAAEWQITHGSPPQTSDGDELYRAFQVIQVAAIREHADVIPGVPEAVDALRARGIAIGSTTGYFRRAATTAARAAARQGFAPDVLIASDDVPAGRPEPWMVFRNLQELRVFPPCLAIKVGDTAVDMAEGRNAGTWAIGVSETGNEMGLSAEALAAMDATERALAAEQAAAHLREAGAHLVIPSAAAIGAAVDAIEARLNDGERP